MASYIIGVDVGYGNTKTAHSCFSSGIKLLSSKPPISTRVIETTSGFYTIGNGKLSIQSSKTEDENMRALTMAGIAEELKRTHTTVADVYLYNLCISIWEEITLDSTSLPFTTTAAAVSSQEHLNG